MSWLKYSERAIAALAGGLCLVALTNLKPSTVTPIRSRGRVEQARMIEPCVVGGPLALRFQEPELQLPDLTGDLFLGAANGRPDRQEDQLRLELSNGEGRTAAIGEPCYLTFDGQYHFSKGETNLWCLPCGGDEVEVVLRKGDGALLREVVKPTVKVPEKGTWILANMRVDSSLLARMRARWYGEDLFLTQHGGEEYDSVAGKQRIDFGEGPGRYSCYVGPGDQLIYLNHRWREVDRPTEGYPLLQVKRVDSRTLNFELWDLDGRQQIALSLARARDPWLPGQLREQLRLIGAKTHTHYVLDVAGERMDVTPGEWLFLGEDGWEKLSQLEEIDSYVARQRVGELLVIDQMKKEGGKKVLQGHLFNKSRSDVKLVEVGE